MALHMNTADMSPRRLAQNYENMQQRARNMVTAAYDGVMPDPHDVEDLHDQQQACEAELADFERTYESYNYQKSILIYKQAYEDTMRGLRQVVHGGVHYVI